MHTRVWNCTNHSSRHLSIDRECFAPFSMTMTLNKYWLVTREEYRTIKLCTEAAYEILESIEESILLEPGGLGYGIRTAALFTATIVLFMDMSHRSNLDRLLEADDRVIRALRLLE
jgi:hypothetical protein